MADKWLEELTQRKIINEREKRKTKNKRDIQVVF